MPSRRPRREPPEDDPPPAAAFDSDLDDTDLDDPLPGPELALTQPCPECGGEMELLTSDTYGAVLVYECLDCGMQTQVTTTEGEELYEFPDGFEDEPEESTE